MGSLFQTYGLVASAESGRPYRRRSSSVKSRPMLARQRAKVDRGERRGVPSRSRFLIRAAHASTDVRFQDRSLAGLARQPAAEQKHRLVDARTVHGQSIAQILNIGRNIRESFEWKEFAHEDIGRVLEIVGVRADEMVQFFSTPLGIDIVLREHEQQQRAIPDGCDEVVAEDIARLEAMVDEEILAVVAWAGVQVVGKRGDPAVLRG